MVWVITEKIKYIYSTNNIQYSKTNNEPRAKTSWIKGENTSISFKNIMQTVYQKDTFNTLRLVTRKKHVSVEPKITPKSTMSHLSHLQDLAEQETTSAVMKHICLVHTRWFKPWPTSIPDHWRSPTTLERSRLTYQRLVTQNCQRLPRFQNLGRT